LEIAELLTLKKTKKGDLEFKLASTEYTIKPSKKTLDCIEKDLSDQVKGDEYVHDATMWCGDILKQIRKARGQAK